MTTSSLPAPMRALAHPAFRYYFAGQAVSILGSWIQQVALAWLLRHPARVLPVMGTGKIERLREAVAAESLTLDRQQWFTIWEASAGHEVP